VTKHPIIVYDNQDDRREFINLMACLPPRVRLDWMIDCCKRACSPKYSHVKPKVKKEMGILADRARWDDQADARLTQEFLQDWLMLICQFKFDAEASLKRLVSLAKKHGRRLSWRPT
jgi:hypothetical protein